MSAGVNAGAAAVAATIQAVRAMGVIVQVDPEEFLGVVRKHKEPLVVYAGRRWFSPKYQYLTCYKGFAFYTRSSEPLDLPSGVELIQAKSIWLPG